jgi:hypothetical protein
MSFGEFRHPVLPTYSDIGNLDSILGRWRQISYVPQLLSQWFNAYHLQAARKGLIAKSRPAILNSVVIEL